jgi:hypothetical protein
VLYPVSSVDTLLATHLIITVRWRRRVYGSSHAVSTQYYGVPFVHGVTSLHVRFTQTIPRVGVLAPVGVLPCISFILWVAPASDVENQIIRRWWLLLGRWLRDPLSPWLCYFCTILREENLFKVRKLFPKHCSQLWHVFAHHNHFALSLVSELNIVSTFSESLTCSVWNFFRSRYMSSIFLFKSARPYTAPSSHGGICASFPLSSWLPELMVVLSFPMFLSDQVTWTWGDEFESVTALMLSTVLWIFWAWSLWPGITQGAPCLCMLDKMSL